MQGHPQRPAIQVSLPPFREAFPDALIYERPQSSRKSTSIMHKQLRIQESLRFNKHLHMSSEAALPGTDNDRRTDRFATSTVYLPSAQSFAPGPAGRSASSPRTYLQLPRHDRDDQCGKPHKPSPAPHYPPPRFPTPPIISRPSSTLIDRAIVGRPALQCTEANCGRVYTCVGNLNRHRKVAHGICPKREKLRMQTPLPPPSE